MEHFSVGLSFVRDEPEAQGIASSQVSKFEDAPKADANSGFTRQTVNRTNRSPQ